MSANTATQPIIAGESASTYGNGPPQKNYQQYASILKDLSRPDLKYAGACFVAPWILFTVVFAAVSFNWRYAVPWLYYLVLVGAAAVVLACLFLACKVRSKNTKERKDTSSGMYGWYLYALFSLLLAWVFAFVFGDMNFWYNTQPYYEYSDHQIYANVDPSQTGVAIMDAGQVEFKYGSRLDLTKSMGFKDLNWYCVAPIQLKNAGADSKYDFWAIGINCCSSMPNDYFCGDFADKAANSGLRLLRDEQRPFFKLAVQQAESAYGLEAPNPMFFYWMHDAVDVLKNQRNQGILAYVCGVLTYFVICLFASIAMLSLLAKHQLW